jgi:hypothetical protein
MNYCSIEDAWGNNDYITDNFKKYDNKIIEKNENISENFKNIHEDTQNHNIKYTCDDFINHLNHCPICKQKMQEQFGFKLIDKIRNLIDDNKDNIILILLVLFILIFFNLIFSIFRNNYYHNNYNGNRI